jgi:hypothetical protein
MRSGSVTCLVLSCTVLLLGWLPVDAQYQGKPVQRDRLVKTLRSKQFQTRDIVQVITESGVDFRVTPEVERELIAAGARLAVIDAVRQNYRGGAAAANTSTAPLNNGRTAARPTSPSYNALLDDAVEAYDISKNVSKAEAMLLQAIELQPNHPRGYQLLGFLNLYGRKDMTKAEEYWQRSISLGGNAVLRVIHDHDGSFLRTCDGSLYISRTTLRFESDNNEHTFETADTNIRSIDVNSKWLRAFQLKGGSFKVVLRKEDGTSRYSFAPLSGKSEESKMIIRLIGKS